MRIGIFGLPNSGKSQFRRWLVAELRKNGYRAEHWDADRFKKARCEADNDMKEPIDSDTETIWLIEDVRGTVPHKTVTKIGEKEGAWKPLFYYDRVIYLVPDWPTYATFWVDRALQWMKLGAGNWMREDGWEKLDDKTVIVRKVQYFLAGRTRWFEQDQETLVNHSLSFPYLFWLCVHPTKEEEKIAWGITFSNLLDFFVKTK